MSTSTEQNQNTNQENNSVNNDNANNDDTNFNLEESKTKLEFISVLLALISLVSAALIKVLSLGRYLYFSFDIDYCELMLTNTDLITFFVSMFFCASAISYCFFTHKIRNGITNMCKKSLEKSNKIVIKIIKIIPFALLHAATLLVYLFIGVIVIGILCNFSAMESLRYELISSLAYTFTFVISISCFTLVEEKNSKMMYKIISVILLFSLCYAFIQTEYEGAENQTNFEIITVENGENIHQEYAVISKGECYSAYRCSTLNEDDRKILIIYKNYHKYFALDEYETQKVDYDKHRIEALQDNISMGFTFNVTIDGDIYCTT